jgi:hypothetical protein
MAQSQRLIDARRADFDNRRPMALLLQTEIFWRLNRAGYQTIEFPPYIPFEPVQRGYRFVQLGEVAGADPLEAVATYLEFIVAKLPN